MAHEIERTGACGPQLGHDFDDLGDDLARLLDHHRIAHPDVLAADLILVVEGGAADGGAGQEDRFQFGDRGEDAGTSHLHGDGAEDGAGMVRLVLEGLGPTRCLGGEAQLFTLAEVIDLDDRAVDLVGELVAGLAEFVDRGQHGVEATHGGAPRLGAEAELAEDGQQLALTADLDTLDFALGVAEDLQGTLGHDPAVELLEGAGGGIAGVGELGFAAGHAVGVEGGKPLLAHEDLAARLEDLGRFRRVEAQGDAGDGADVGRDVVPLDPVAPGQGLDQHAALVAQGETDPVHLGLNDVVGLRAAQPAHDILVEVAEVLVVVGVVEAEHRHRMPPGDEFGQGFGPDPLAGRVGGDEVGELALDRDQFPVQGIVGLVADLRCRLHVVEAIVAMQLLTEFLEAELSLCPVHGCTQGSS